MASSVTGRLIKAALLGGLVAGTVDVGAAATIFHAGPDKVLRAIASGLLGKDAAHGGNEVLIIGLLLQWAMSIVIAFIYDVAALRIPTLARQWFAWGLAYGVGVYFVMTFVVVPLSNAPSSGHPQSLMSRAENMAAMLLFGVIVAFFARSLAAKKA